MKKCMILLFLVLLVACGSKETSVKKYYFPYAQFIKPMVYQYVDKANPSQITYWYLRTSVVDGDTFMLTSVYDGQLNLKNIFENRITAEGCELSSMFVSSKTGKLVKCSIKDNDVFKWKVKPNETIALRISVATEDSTETEEIVTDRKFFLKKEVVTFNGTDYNAIKVTEVTLINHIKVNRTQTEEQHRTCMFAEGLGLYSFETSYPDGKMFTMELVKTFTDLEWKLLTKAKESRTDSTAVQ